MSKIILISSDPQVISKVSRFSFSSGCEFKHYATKEEWENEKQKQVQKETPVIPFPYQKLKMFGETKNFKKLNDIMYESIRNTLKQTNGNVYETCRILKISRSTLYRKVIKFNIDLNIIRHESCLLNKRRKAITKTAA